ncbi:hypothetical protein SCHPADRAFT_942742 [Schizopora paradoxa]|uniref:Uncharacterized protein n=1 Tax=Schizopora paradoxa TaxID=27342 RepID=A0A0H2RFH7_9AGAM|nr:hypothetical protein SCHPADRAFT_942742 [Schizopora paradoxa]
MDDFSWTDGLRAALRPCLPCFASSREEDGGTASDSNEGARSRNPRAQATRSRQNDLDGLLRTPEDTDVDAETWSLHSNVGRERSRKKRKGKKRSTKNSGSSSSSFFSYFVGGRSNQPIRLPESDSEDDGAVNDRLLHPRSLARSNSSSAASVSSSLAFDSDASSLDATAIGKLSAQEALARAEAAAEEARARVEAERLAEEARQERAEAKRRRKERRELRRASQLIAMGVEDVPPGAFDYQQHQQGYPSPELLPPPSYFSTGPHANAGYAPIPADFTQPHIRVMGDVFNAPSPLAGVIEEEDHDDDGHTDFGAEVYTIKARRSKSNLRAGTSDGGSSSRSSRSHATSATTTTSSTSSSADPSAVAYQRFLAMAALNGGQAALAAIPSPSTPALSLSPSSATGMGPGFNSGAEQPQPSFAINEDNIPPLADPPKRKKKRRPETWIAPSSASPHSLTFDPQSMKAPPPASQFFNLEQDRVRFQIPPMQGNAIPNSTLGLDVNSNVDLQDGLAKASRKKKNRMSMSGAL